MSGLVRHRRRKSISKYLFLLYGLIALEHVVNESELKSKYEKAISSILNITGCFFSLWAIYDLFAKIKLIIINDQPKCCFNCIVSMKILQRCCESLATTFLMQTQMTVSIS